jgi:CBS domain-containing membrane protein
MKHSLHYLKKYYAFYLEADQPPASWLERLRSVFGAFLGLVLVFAVAKFLGERSGMNEWLMASLGARLFWYLHYQAVPWLSLGQ